MQAGKQVIYVCDSRFLGRAIETSQKKPEMSLDFHPTLPLVTVRVHFDDPAGRPSVHDRMEMPVSGKAGDVEYSAGFHLSGCTAEVRLPAKLTNVELHEVFDSEYLCSWRFGNSGPWRQAPDPSVMANAVCGIDRMAIQLETVPGTIEITVQEQKLSVLTVHVLDGDGKPIAKCSLRIKYTDSARPSKASAAKAAAAKPRTWIAEEVKGQWRLERLLPDHEFTLSVRAAGFQTASQTMKLADGESREILVKLVAENKKSATINRSVPPPSSATTVPPASKASFKEIRGTFSDEFTNSPIAGATVELKTGEAGKIIAEGPGATVTEIQWVSEPIRTVTDAAGNYSFALTPEQSAKPNFVWTIDAKHPSYLPLDEQPVHSRLSHLSDSAGSFYEYLTLLPGEDVSGTVVDPSGRPLANARVTLSSTGQAPVAATSIKPPARSVSTEYAPKYSGSDFATTDAQGRFRVRAIRAFEQGTIEVYSGEFAPLREETRDHHGDLGIFQLRLGTKVTGTVFPDRGMSGFKNSCRNVSVRHRRRATDQGMRCYGDRLERSLLVRGPRRRPLPV